MKILYVGQFEEPHRTENYVAHALESHGVKMICCPYVNQDFRSLKNLIKKHRPDAVLFSKAEPVGVSSLLEWCKEQGVLTVCWVWDLYWGYRPERPQQFRADLLFTTDEGHESHFSQNGYNHAVLRQGIHEPEHIDYPASHSHDVCFVGGGSVRRGHGYRYRTKLLRHLSKTYGNRFIHHMNVRGLRLNEALSRVKIVVGDSYPSPNYWSNRIYEILGRGGFLLHPKTEGLDEEFEDGVHYVSYDRDDFKGLESLIGYWLSHDEEREKIRRQGFGHVGKHYTYRHRAAVLLEAIRNKALTPL